MEVVLRVALRIGTALLVSSFNVSIYRLNEELRFPHPRLATKGGLLAVGGDLTPERLLLAYSNGIFPWYSEGRPILWWCPTPRLVLEPHAIRINRTLRKVMKRKTYRLTMDLAFETVIDACADVPRPEQDGTWITADMRDAYIELHRLGFAHSVEAWEGTSLVGGLYGLSIGGMFCGESMFALRPNASKIAFSTLAVQLERWLFDLIDCQVVTEHLTRFGAHEIELDDFLARVHASVKSPTRRGPWSFDSDL